MPVEVLLKSKIAKLGAEADVVSVKPGYARNYLFPKGLAVVATSATKKQVELLKKLRAEREADEMNKAQEIAGKLNKQKLTFILATVEGQDKVFGSVTTLMIVDRLKNEGLIVDRKQIKLDKPIKDMGEHEITIEIHSDVSARLKIIVTPPAVEKADYEVKAEEAKGKKTRPAKKAS
jgi:large subunit ribosomal protein L9